MMLAVAKLQYVVSSGCAFSLVELQFFASLFYNFIWHSTFRFLCIAINQMKSTISGIQMLARWLGKLVLELASSAVAATCGDCCSHPSCK